MQDSQRTETIQWIGAVLIILGHLLNAIGPSAYPLNVCAFTIGTIFFLVWSLRVKNRAQIAVNVVAIVIGSVGLYRAVV